MRPCCQDGPHSYTSVPQKCSVLFYVVLSFFQHLEVNPEEKNTCQNEHVFKCFHVKCQDRSRSVLKRICILKKKKKTTPRDVNYTPPLSNDISFQQTEDCVGIVWAPSLPRPPIVNVPHTQNKYHGIHYFGMTWLSLFSLLKKLSLPYKWETYVEFFLSYR